MAVSKGFVTPSNFSFNSPWKIWTEIITIRGYKLSSAKLKGEVHGARFKCWRVLHIVIFRATCQAILLWQTLREKLFGESKTEKRFSATMLTAVVWTIRYKKKKNPAQGFALIILILKANIHKDAIDTIDTLPSYLGVAQLTQGWKREIITTLWNCATKWKKMKGSWRVDPRAVSQKKVFVVDLTLTVY